MTATVSPIDQPLPDLTNPEALAASWHMAHGEWRDHNGLGLHDLVHNLLGHDKAERVWLQASQLFEQHYAAEWCSPAIPRQHHDGGTW